MSNDYIAHYGVKGMKWKHKKRELVPVSGRLREVSNDQSESKNDNPIEVNKVNRAKGVSGRYEPTPNNVSNVIRDLQSKKNTKKKTFFTLTKKKINAKKEYLDNLKEQNKSGNMDWTTYNRKKQKAMSDLAKLNNRFIKTGLKKKKNSKKEDDFYDSMMRSIRGDSK